MNREDLGGYENRLLRMYNQLLFVKQYSGVYKISDTFVIGLSLKVKVIKMCDSYVTLLVQRGKWVLRILVTILGAHDKPLGRQANSYKVPSQIKRKNLRSKDLMGME